MCIGRQWARAHGENLSGYPNKLDFHFILIIYCIFSTRPYLRNCFVSNEHNIINFIGHPVE